MTYPTAESFYDSEPSRIIGTENEYGAGLEHNHPVNYLRVLRQLGIMSVQHSTNDTCDIFTDVGSRIYDDQEHIEIASAESLGPLEAALTDHAGAATIREMTEIITAEYGDFIITCDNKYPLRRAATYHLNDRGSAVITKGYHQNLQFPATLATREWDVFEPVLSTFIAVKPLISGAGFVTGHYSMSQKMHGVGDTVTSKHIARLLTHGKKPLAAAIYNHMDLFDKSSKEWGILEVRSSDPSLNPHTTYLDLASISLCLRLLERRSITARNFEDFTFANPVRAARSMAETIETALSEERVTLAGESLRSPQMLGRFAAAIHDLAMSTNLPADEKNAAAEWCALAGHIAALDPQHPDLESLPPRIEWAAKQRFITEHTADKQDIFYRMGLDMFWANVGKTKALGRSYFQKNDPTYQSYQQKIDHYTRHAPKGTRAHVRADLIKSGRALRADWANITTQKDDYSEDDLRLANPYDTALR